MASVRKTGRDSAKTIHLSPSDNRTHMRDKQAVNRPIRMVTKSFSLQVFLKVFFSVCFYFLYTFKLHSALLTQREGFQKLYSTLDSPLLSLWFTSFVKRHIYIANWPFCMLIQHIDINAIAFMELTAMTGQHDFALTVIKTVLENLACADGIMH